jgi:hypothetical protein
VRIGSNVNYSHVGKKTLSPKGLLRMLYDGSTEPKSKEDLGDPTRVVVSTGLNVYVTRLLADVSPSSDATRHRHRIKVAGKT